MTRASFEERTARGPNAASAEEVRACVERVRSLVESKLDELVPSETREPSSVHAAIRWSLFAPAKRLRPALVFAAGETFGASAESLVRTACAFELLQSLAFQAVAEDEALDASLRVRLVAELARAAGTPEGMVAGQAHDLAAEARMDVGGEELELIHRRKTGALIAASARAGAIVAGASQVELEAVGRYAFDLGLLFQITDDLLDVTASAADLGKTPGKDARARKATYPSLYGLGAARVRAQSVYEAACAALDPIEKPTNMLRAFARLVLERNS